MPLRKVVITGLGAISPFGVGVSALMEHLYAGDSAVVNMRAEWEPKIKDLSCWIAAPVRGGIDGREIPRTFRRTMGPTAMLAYLACREALAQAVLPGEWPGSGRMGVSFASTTGSVSSMETFFRECIQNGSIRGLPAGSFFQIMSHTAAANVAHALGICGRTIAPNSACTSSAQAIGLAFEAIRAGEQDVMLAGGADELHPIVSGSLDLVQASSWHFNDNPARAPRPFDRDRDGTVCGEGSGALVLEAEETARGRGARVLGEIAAHATTTDGAHLAESHSGAIVKCFQNALDKMHLMPQEIDYINAHATGTVVGDLAEAQAIREIFGAVVPVSSLKGAIGHTLGASCAIELIASLQMTAAGRLIPTRNLEHPGEGCEGIGHVGPGESRPVRTFLKNSFAFGGINTVLVVKRNIDE
jgi:3-oxoacyl-[acyl-carrier-protein] synthase II